MRTVLLLSTLSAVVAHAQDTGGSMRDKTHARIMAVLPPPPAPVEEPGVPSAAADAIVDLEPLVVYAPAVRQLAAEIESKSRRLKEERFTPIKGGTLYQRGSLKIGAWGDRSGLTLLKKSF